MGSERPTRVRYLVLFGLCLAAGIAYIHRGCYGVAESTIREELQITEHQSGLIMSIFFWVYAIFQIPTGVLVDRWGPRHSLLLFGILGAVTLGIGATTMFVSGMVAFAILFAGRLLMGVAQAGLFPASTRCLAFWLPANQRGMATGLLQSAMSLGGTMGVYITAMVLDIAPWPWMFIILAIPGIIWSLWFFNWYRDSPKDHRSVNQLELHRIESGIQHHQRSETGPTPWFRLFTDSRVIWVAVQQVFRSGANVFWITWCPTYLQNVFSLTPTQAGQLTSIPYSGVILGSLFGGLIADWIFRRTGSKTWSRKWLSIGALLIGVVLFLLASRERGSPVAETRGEIPTAAIEAVIILFFAAFFCSISNPTTYTVTIDIGGRYPAVVFGTMNMMGNIGSAIFPLLIPIWVSRSSWGTIPIFMGTLYGLGMICWFFLNVNGEVLDD